MGAINIFTRAKALNVPGRGTIFAVVLHSADIGALIGHEVTINGRQYMCTGVDYQGSPVAGSKAGLVVREIPDGA